MNILPSDYCGDELMEEYLEKAGSEVSIFSLYGLLYGCLAAPNLVMPSVLMPAIFGKKGADFETKDQAQETVGNIMALWNLLNRWDPEIEDLRVPAIEYPTDKSGVMHRLSDMTDLVDSFIGGLELGGIDLDEPPVDLKNDAESLSKIMDIFYSYLEVMDKEKGMTPEQLDEAMKAISKGELVITSRIANIHMALKKSRMQAAEDLRGVDEALKKGGIVMSPKIGRNDPCPCGSGKKYKKCCGITH